MSFTIAEVGDKVECLLNGKGVINNVSDNMLVYGVSVTFPHASKNYTLEGKMLTNNVNRSLFYLDKEGNRCEERPVEFPELPFYFTSDVKRTYKVTSFTGNDNTQMVESGNSYDHDCMNTYYSLTKKDIAQYIEIFGFMTEAEYKEKFHPEVPWDKVPVDTKVYVHNTYANKLDVRFRYYAGNGEVFSEGRSSWSNEGFSKLKWENMYLAEAITIAGIKYKDKKIEDIK